MYAHVGDRLVVEGDLARAGLIIGVPHDDGTPPYIVKWLASGSIAMVVPNPFARIVPVDPAAGPRPHEDASPAVSGKGGDLRASDAGPSALLEPPPRREDKS